MDFELSFGILLVEVQTDSRSEKQWELEEVKVKELGQFEVASFGSEMRFSLG